MIHELRIYTAAPGRLPDLMARFRDHTMALFEKHGITNVGYWTNSIGGRNDELWYIIGFESLAHREQAWGEFVKDPEWTKVRADSEANGPLLSYLENRILNPTSWSPLR
jgi:hypothetical protein